MLLHHRVLSLIMVTRRQTFAHALQSWQNAQWSRTQQDLIRDWGMADQHTLSFRQRWCNVNNALHVRYCDMFYLLYTILEIPLWTNTLRCGRTGEICECAGFPPFVPAQGWLEHNLCSSMTSWVQLIHTIVDANRGDLYVLTTLWAVPGCKCNQKLHQYSQNMYVRSCNNMWNLLCREKLVHDGRWLVDNTDDR